MIDVAAQRHILCTPDELLAFVMDIEAYQQVDRKLGRIYAVKRSGEMMLFKFKPSLAGLPSPPMWQRVVLTPGVRIDIRNASALMHKLVPFHGSFVCEAVEGGTLVTRRLRFCLPAPLCWLLDARLRRFLEEDIPLELDTAAAHLERRPTPNEVPPTTPT